MKTRLSILSAVVLTLSLIACTAPAADTSPTPIAAVEPTAVIVPTPTALPSPAVVTFIDPVLEELVRGAMGKPEGMITAAEAMAVTRLNLNNQFQQTVLGTAQIADLSGLEHFTSLVFLDLSAHAIEDVSPLAGLTQLTLLSLGGNPVADLSPLAGLTNLQGLILSNCAAHDYNPLAELVNLEFLMLDHAAISDAAPLASLTNLKHLYLAGSPVQDYFVLADIYPNLLTKDFTTAFTLKELGFDLNDDVHMAKYANESLDVLINHAEWGAPPMEWDENCVRLSLNLADGYIMKVVHQPDLDTYQFGMGRDGALLTNYVYDAANGDFTFRDGDRERSEQAVLAALDAADGEDVLLVPLRIYHDSIQTVFNMSADALYALPFEPPTLASLGFFPDEDNAVWRYEQRDGRDVNLEIHRPEWGVLDYDFFFFTALSEEYRLILTYHSDERKLVVGADDNDLGGADFEYFLDTDEHIDGWCSNKDLTVEEYFLTAFNDPAIEDIYLYSVELMMQYIADRFGMSLDELMALPVGEY